MAASSSNNSCVYCQDSSSDCFSNGWKLRNAMNSIWDDSVKHFIQKKMVEVPVYVLWDDLNGVICMDCSTTKCITPESLIPLFEKKATASDSNSKVGRIVITKKHAEACFPEVTDPKGIPLSVMDTQGKEWDLHLVYWPHLNSRMYGLAWVKIL